MKKNDIFETSIIGGFNKVDVINYIESIQLEKEKLIKEIFSEKELNRSLLNEFTEEKSKEKNNFAILEKKNNDIKSYKEKIILLDNKLKELQSKRNSLIAKISKQEEEEKQYKNSDKAEELMIESKKMANALIQESKRKSELKLQKTEIECSKILNDANNIINGINKDLRSYIITKKAFAEKIKKEYFEIEKQLSESLSSADKIIEDAINKNKI